MPLAPECLDALKKAKAAGHSLAEIGEMLKWPGKPSGYTRAAVSALLSEKYKARDMSKVEAAIRATLMREKVTCPVLGQIPVADCAAWQRRDLSSANNESVRMYRACRGGCPNSKIKAPARFEVPAAKVGGAP